MRILFAIAHFFAPEAKGPRVYGSMGREPHNVRLDSLKRCLGAIHQLLGPSQYGMDIARRLAVPANRLLAHSLDVVICTAGTSHLLDHLKLPAAFQHHPTDADPKFLGYECHAVMRERLGQYDYYCYLEDDLVLRDPLFIDKISWFNRIVGEDSLLQPNRYEIAPQGKVWKLYLDGPITPRATASYQDVRDEPELSADLFGRRILFRRTVNPHAGSFFLTQGQLAVWVARPYFLDRSAAFVGPLESAASLGIMRTFKVYKPAIENAAFLEIEHPGTSYLGLVGRGIKIADADGSGAISP